MTKLESPLRRELALGRDRYTLTITPDGLSLVPKGRRKGYELAWRAFIDGDAALAVALNASLANGPSAKVATTNDKPKKPPRLRSVSTPSAARAGNKARGRRSDR